MLLLWILLLHVFMFRVCLRYAVLSVSCSLMIICWERADPLNFLCVMFFLMFLSLYHMVSWVRCGTWLIDSCGNRFSAKLYKIIQFLIQIHVYTLDLEPLCL